MTNQPKDVEEIVFDCFDECCTKCSVCKYLDFLERAEGSAPAGSSIERNPLIEDYLKRKEQYLTTHTDKRVREEWQKAIDLADKIESQYTNTEFNEWRAFKGFRNALNDKLQALSDRPKDL